MSANLAQGTQEEYSDLLNSEMMQKIRNRVVFCPGETIKVWDRIMDVRVIGSKESDKQITQGRFIIVRSNKYGERLMNQEIRNSDAPSFGVEEVFNARTGVTSTRPALFQVLKYAKDSADELESAYKVRGLVQISELIGLDELSVSKIERLLLPEKEGLIDIPKTLSAFSDWVTEKVLDYEPSSLEAKVLSAMMEGINQSIAYQNEVTGILESELFGRRHNAGAQGIPKLDSTHLHYFRMLGKKPQDQQLNDISDRANQALMNQISMGNQLLPENVVATVAGVECRFCTSKISPAAKKCPVCREWLDEEAEVESNIRSAKRNKSNGRKQQG